VGGSDDNLFRILSSSQNSAGIGLYTASNNNFTNFTANSNLKGGYGINVEGSDNYFINGTVNSNSDTGIESSNSNYFWNLDVNYNNKGFITSAGSLINNSACFNLVYDFECSSFGEGVTGTNNSFNSVSSCDDGWPVLGEDYNSCDVGDLIDVYSCGGLSKEDTTYVIKNNVTATGTCFSINAKNITLDCDGYSVNYSYSGTVGYGVDVNNHNATIKNCFIEEGTSSTNSKHGIYLRGNYNHSIIENNTIITSGLSSKGIILWADLIEIVNNTIITTGNWGFGIASYSDNNNIFNNNITTSGDISHGLFFSSGYGSIIFNNTIMTTGDGGRGIYLSESYNFNLSNNTINAINSQGIYIPSSENITHYNHTFVGNTQKSKPIYFYFGQDNLVLEDDEVEEISIINSENLDIRNLTVNNGLIYIAHTNNFNITENNITNNIENGIGIQVVSSNNSNISNNKLSISGSSSRCIYLDSSSNSIIQSNDITSSSSYWSCLNIYSDSNSVQINNNNITTSGIFSQSINFNGNDNNVVFNNQIKTYGSGSVGILGSSVINLNISNNNMISNGASVTGISLLSVPNNNTIVNNNISQMGNYAIRIRTGSNNSVINNSFSENSFDLLFDSGVVKNAEIENTKMGVTSSYGNISWSPLLTFSSYNLDNSLMLDDNSFYVNSVEIPGLNKSAQLSFFDTNSLGFTDRYALIDGGVCPASICTEIQDADTYIFNVTHFTTYSVGSLGGAGDGDGADEEGASGEFPNCGEFNNWCAWRDANRDGVVDILDLVFIRNQLGKDNCGEVNNWCLGADVNKDGRVDVNDLSYVRESFEVGDAYESGELVEEDISEPEVTEVSGCVSNFSCSVWGECEVSYSFDDLIRGVDKISGKQDRVCKDFAGCFADIVQKRKCSVLLQIYAEEREFCGEDYLWIYDKNTNKLLGRIRDRKKAEVPSLDIKFLRAEPVYCDYCFNGVMDGDEEGVDCGGSCRSCEEIFYSPDVFGRVMRWLGF